MPVICCNIPRVKPTIIINLNDGLRSVLRGTLLDFTLLFIDCLIESSSIKYFDFPCNFLRTDFDSLINPLTYNHLGLLGTKYKAKKYKIAGINSTPNIHLHTLLSFKNSDPELLYSLKK